MEFGNNVIAAGLLALGFASAALAAGQIEVVK